MRYLTLLLLLATNLVFGQKLKQIERSPVKWFIPVAKMQAPDGTYFMKYDSLQGIMDSVGIALGGSQDLQLVLPNTLSLTGDATTVAMPWIKWQPYTSGTDTIGFTLINEKNDTLNVKTSCLQISGNANQAPQGSGFGTPISAVGINTTTPIFTLHIEGTDGMKLPVGTTNQRPATLQPGVIRFNNITNKFEGWTGSVWVNFH